MDETLVSSPSPSMLWCAQGAHQNLKHPCHQTGRLVIMDNFYTRHLLARQLAKLSDKEFAVLDTVRLNNVDYINSQAIKTALEQLKTAERGEWRLRQALNAACAQEARPQWYKIADLLSSKIDQMSYFTPPASQQLPKTASRCTMSKLPCASTSWFHCRSGYVWKLRSVLISFYPLY